MELLPQVQQALAFADAVRPTDIKDKLEASRVFYERLNPLAGEPEKIFNITNQTIEFPDRKVNLRIYRPSGQKSLAALIYFHGGGFFKGSLETHDRPLRQLANASGVVVISVDYRLAPEYPCPHGLNDCIDATEWIMNHAGALNIGDVSVAGDSAGGALAIAVAGKVKGIKTQVLIYPLIDPSFATPSWKEFADGPILTLKSAHELWAYYGANAELMFNPDLFVMPDTLILIGGYDPLRDEVLAYAQQLRKSGVPVTERFYPKMPHGFFQMGGVIEEGREAIETVARYINSHTSPTN
ncbi:MAG TPA: alpha/beta hydrolase [Dinghuibacter sp.]|jgi:acetyl esterase|uniref:alpha/beta hydrolase n=1 Tax=Dinghuibacter sp. TaxID=2024697 RepID=UPI002C51E070|nr:alpha/beta hydrolase [Dinghuibacter sp.]HTJ11254.1 alpha/beta hydrolase [Dinghuibacter sp.]